MLKVESIMRLLHAQPQLRQVSCLMVLLLVVFMVAYLKKMNFFKGETVITRATAGIENAEDDLMSRSTGSNKEEKALEALEMALKKEKVPSCGQVCSYSGKSNPGIYFPYMEKSVTCRNILLRMGSEPKLSVTPPPNTPPEEIYDAFMQHNECSLKIIYNKIRPVKPITPKTISFSDIESMREEDKSGGAISIYKDDGLLKKTLLHQQNMIAGKRGLVVGTGQPWLEAMLLNLGAEHVTTIQSVPITYEHPQLSTKTPKQLAANMLYGNMEPFDFAAAYVAIENKGLGREGEPLNPYGDLEAMAQVWCMVRPGGVFIFGTQKHGYDDSCIISWYSKREYSNQRLQHVTANWKVLEIYQEHNSLFQPIYILRKPGDSDK